MFLLMIASASGDSLTRDELAHIVSGYSYLVKGDYRLNPEHPPLIKDLSALPLLFINPKFPDNNPAWTKETNGQWALGDAFLFKTGNDADEIIFLARLPIILLTALLGFLVFRFTKELAGPAAALLALTLFAFSPNIIAHSRLVTTDLGITFFTLLSFYYFWKFLKAPTWKNIFFAGIIFGLTHLTKFSSPLLFPVFGIMLIAASFGSDDKKQCRALIKMPYTDFLKHGALKKFYNYTAGFILITALAYLLVGSYYAFHLKNMPVSVQHRLIDDSIGQESYKPIKDVLHKMADNAVLRPYSQYFLGFFMVYAHSSSGHTTFFMGEMGKNWWNYYLIAYLIKEPIPSQLFFYLAIAFALSSLVKKKFLNKRKAIGKTLLSNIKILFKWISKHYLEIGMISFVVLLLIIGAKSKLQLGIRYIMPVFPLIYILTAVSIKKFFHNQKNKLFLPYYLAVFIFLSAWLIIEGFAAYPSYIAYYNEFIDGHKNGYKYLVDSNTDWGQDLKRLAKFAEDNKIEKIKVDYFGGADPEYYLKDKLIVWGYDKGPTTGWLAISASALQWNRGIPENKKIKPAEYNYRWLDKYEPVAQIGYSIFVYNIN